MTLIYLSKVVFLLSFKSILLVHLDLEFFHFLLVHDPFTYFLQLFS